MELLSGFAIRKFVSDTVKVYQAKYFILIDIDARELRRFCCF
jgi:hypothetical protein